MAGPLYRFLAYDNVALGALPQLSFGCRARIYHAAFGVFRAGLLKHIGIEEKILLPAVRRLCCGKPVPIASRLQLEHDALAALLVPTPTRMIVAALRGIFSGHRAIEEQPGGFYDMCEWLAGPEADTLLARLRTAPEVVAPPYCDSSKTIGAMHRALARAGYNLTDFDTKEFDRV